MSSSRQLAAILFADIQGYTALMQEDEAKARSIRDKFKKELEKEVATHNGQIIQFSGDGVLCIFRSAIEAVRAAIGVQIQMRESPVVPLRIGIHSGDVMFEEENIYGDGVNVASRIESFAVAGGVFISGKVYDEIRNQKDIEAVSLGKYQLKNVNAPVEIFAISNEGLQVPLKENLEGKGVPVSGRKISLPKIFIWVAAVVVIIILGIMYRGFFIPEAQRAGKPKVIAVLPFSNLSASKEDEYFTDGMGDEILTQISKIGGLNVMSRTSMLQYKGTKKTMKQISEELGADVLLEGTVQKSNDKVRINVQLIDAKNDKHLWAESYDRDIKDIFVIQTDIAKQIALALHSTLTEKEKTLFEETPTDNLRAYDFYLRGNQSLALYRDYDKMEEGAQAARMYEQAINLDPKFTAAYSALIKLFIGVSWIKGDEFYNKAKEWLDKMLALNIDDAYKHSALAVFLYQGEKDYPAALAELNLVDEMLGNGKSTYEQRAEILRSMGRIDESLNYLKKQSVLFQRSSQPLARIAETYKLKRDFDSSLYYINKAIEINPDVAGLYMLKSMYYAELKGDLSMATSILESAAALVDTSGFKSDFTYFESLKGNYENAIRLTRKDIDSLGMLWQYKFLPNDLTIAIMYRLLGKSNEAKVYFQDSHNLTSRFLKQYPDDFRLHSAMGIALAGLGEREKALMEGNRACELMSVSKDAILGISPLEDLALIHTLLGDQDAAIDILEQLLKMPFAWTMSNTIPLYKLHYYWKPLQNNPRFKKMVQQ